MASSIDKVRENRLRRMAKRQGLRFVKSGRRDPRALDYGRYWLMPEHDGAQAPANWDDEYGLSLDEVEAHLTRGSDG